MSHPFALSTCWPRALAAAITLGLVVVLGACAAESDADDGPPPYPLDDVLRLNHLQVKGTHNSYHIAPDWDPVVPAWDYTHQPLDAQLGAQNVRQFELDLYWDKEDQDYDVMHVPLLDDVTTCDKLRDCLGVIDKWSLANADHVPIIIWLEPKNGFAYSGVEAPFDKLQAAILGAVDRSRLVTPDDVRGEHADLTAAIKADGWPTLAASRGKLMLVLLDSGVDRDEYVKGNPALTGRLLFAEGGPDTPWGVVAKIDGPVSSKDAIGQAVKAGRLIRTRADAGKHDIEGDDPPRRKAAFASGAQIVSTDYPAPVAGTGYFVQLPGGGPARCNPLTAPGECTDQALERF